MRHFSNMKEAPYEGINVAIKEVNKCPKFSRAQTLILERLPLNPKAGSMICAGQLLNAYILCLEEGLGHEEYKTGLKRLIHEGYLKEAKSYYKLTTSGEMNLFQHSLSQWAH
jgi:hypothetical protein